MLEHWYDKLFKSKGRIVKASVNRTRVMQKLFSLCLYLSFLHLKPDFRNSSLSSVRLSRVEPRINLQLTGKISLKLDSNSS